MVSTFTTNKNIEQPAFNDFIDSWQVPVNANWAIIDKALGSSTTINTTGLSGTIALTATQYQALTIRFTGTPAGAITYSVPSPVGGSWVVRNDTPISVNFVSAAAPGVPVTVPTLANTIATCDGSATGMRQAVSVPSAAAGSNTQVQFNSGGSLAGSAGLFWDGTFLWMTGLVSGGNSILGNNVGNFVTFNAGTIDFPNNAAFTGNLLYISQSTQQLGVGLVPIAGDKLTVGGRVRSTAGGFTFPDGTTQTTAATSSLPAGSNTQLQFNNGGVFGATANMTYNSGTQVTSLLHLAVAGNTALNAVTMAGNLTVNGLITAPGSISTVTLNASVGITAGALSLTGTPLAVASGGTGGTTQAAAQNGLAVLGRAGGGVATSNYMTGDLLSGQNTTLTPGTGNNTVGINLSANGSLHLSHSGTYVEAINRSAGDGDCIIFNRIGVNIGSISLTAAAVAYNTTSDRREKTTTGLAAGLLDKLDLITVYKGYFNRDEKRAEHHLVMADEIALAVPEIVTGEKDGPRMQQVAWGNAMPWMIGIVKELWDEIRTLKAEIAHLKAA